MNVRMVDTAHTMMVRISVTSPPACGGHHRHVPVDRHLIRKKANQGTTADGGVIRSAKDHEKATNERFLSCEPHQRDCVSG